MPKVLVEYTVTEITRERLWVEADSGDDAIEAVENYEIDNSDSYQVDSICWELSDAEVVEIEAEEEDECPPKP